MGKLRCRTRLVHPRIFCVALAAIACALGCAPPLRSFGPTDVLGAREGLLAFHVRTDTPLAAIRIAGMRRIPLSHRTGTQLRVVAMWPGRYRWWTLELTDAHPVFGPLIFQFPNRNDLDFRVEAGRLNYAGMIDVHRDGYFRVGMRAIDRTALALEDLRAQFPAFVDRYPIAYSGRARHVFLERYLDAKGAPDPAAGPERSPPR